MELGFIGLGAMGAPMVQRLLEAGHAVVVHDVNAAAVTHAESLGAVRASSPKDVASRVETVLVSLPTPDVVKAVAFGADGLAEGNRIKRYVDLSTTGRRVALEVEAELAKRDVEALDAPVSGGVEGAKKGTLAIMSSGPKALFDLMRPVLEVIGKNTFHVGAEVGQGQTLKLCNNLLAATAVAASSEALVMGVKAGLDPQVMLDVINVSSGKNMATERYIPGGVLDRSFSFGFKTMLMTKDVRLCLEEAEALGAAMWVGSAVKQMWTFAMTQGMGAEDITAIIKLPEKWAGVEVSAKS